MLKVGKTTHRIDGVVVSEAEFNRRSRAKKARGAPAVSRAYESPLESIAASVHPAQVQEVRKFLDNRGLRGVEVSSNGRMTFNTRSARRRYLQATAKQDNDGGYGDG